MPIVYFIGMAGSGKTTITKNFGDWLLESSECVARINLDPGVVNLPYNPDYDIRTLVDLSTVMKRDSLGPNGALIRSMEIMIENIDAIADTLKKTLFGKSWVLIDTPGQLELFAFRELGNIIIKKLNRQDSLAIFIVDASNLNKGSDFVMSVLLSLATRFHLEIDVLMILNKVDLVDEKISKFMNMFFDDPDAFVNEMLRDNTGILGELSFDLVDILRQYLPPTRIVSVSAKKKIGFNDLYSIINDALCECGDLQ